MLDRFRAFIQREFHPVQSLVAGFMLIILAGTFALMLPFSSASGDSQPFIDALFTATSAVTTTGLVVVDTGSYYSFFGQAVILSLFQLGGIGYITLIVLAAYLLGERPSLKNGMTLRESIAGSSPGAMKGFIKTIFFYTLLFEGAGAILLALRWWADYPLHQAAWLGIFYAVSAFCTAGFGLFSDSLSTYAGDWAVNAVINSICIGGAMGFFVLDDLKNFLVKLSRGNGPRRLTLHSRLVLLFSAGLIGTGCGFLFFNEESSPYPGLSVRFMSSLFQAVTASTTTGFNTIDIGAMSDGGLFAIVILMFIGAAPGSTGGGIKNTTFGVTVLFVWNLLRGREHLHAFRANIPASVVARASAIGAMAVLLVVVDTLILAVTEKHPFLPLLFEVVSAFGTVGLSTGITPQLTFFGKMLISATMLIGRLGPLALGYSLVMRKRAVYDYAEEEIFVG